MKRRRLQQTTTISIPDGMRRTQTCISEIPPKRHWLQVKSRIESYCAKRGCCARGVTGEFHRIQVLIWKKSLKPWRDFCTAPNCVIAKLQSHDWTSRNWVFSLELWFCKTLENHDFPTKFTLTFDMQFSIFFSFVKTRNADVVNLRTR